MTTRRTTFSWLLATILVTTTVASVSAQSEEATADGWSYFTWTLSEEGASAYNDDGTWRVSGQTLDATDPRASGVLDMAWNATGGGPDDRDLSLWEFRFELTNEDGSWTGTGSTVVSHEGGEDGPETSIEPSRLQGAGAYQGLTLVMITTNRDSDQERWGVIVPSAEVPQAPDSVSAG